MAKPDTVAIRLDLMADHIPYEIAMMRYTEEGVRSRRLPQGTCTNAYIESFAIHARSLVNFLNNRDGAKARDYTDNYTPFQDGRIPGKLVDKLNQQIAHITEKRFNSVEEKLNSDDISKLRRLIDAEIATFVEHQRPQYREVWDTKKHHLSPWNA